MSDVQPEVLVGELPVTARLHIGSEHLRLFVTNKRLLLAHLGKRGAGGIAGSTLLGNLSRGFEDLLNMGRDSRSAKTLEKMTPETILAAHKQNFALRFEEIVSVDLSENWPITVMTVLTGDDKFEFLTRSKFDHVARLLSPGLQGKLVVKPERRR
jgi:hypothetical protein